MPDHRILRALVAFALTLWLGGLGCVIGCEMPAPDSHRIALETPGAESSCPMGAGHHPTLMGQADDDRDKGGTSTKLLAGESSLCPLVGQSADLARKVRLLDGPQALTGRDLIPATGLKPYCDTITVRLTISDRGSTYLRCCVFLI